MDKYVVKLLKRAYRDIDDIFSYIAYEKMAPENAMGQISRIKNEVMSLESYPQSHQDRLVGRYAGKGFKQLIIDNYLVVFRIYKIKYI